jgi:antitoxin (DNA-binding transcriptional repressor) of toxin-antitoxin stability system
VLRANIADLKNNLSRYLQKVRAGETVIVLDRDRPIARIERIGAQESDDERIARLEAAGILTPPENPAPREDLIEYLRTKAPTSKKSIVETLIEDRREGR